MKHNEKDLMNDIFKNVIMTTAGKLYPISDKYISEDQSDFKMKVHHLKFRDFPRERVFPEVTNFTCD